MQGETSHGGRETSRGGAFDQRWKCAAVSGEEAAIKRLAEFALGPVYRFCLYRLGGDEHLTEDVVQETLVRSIRELDKYQPQRCGDNIYAWLTGLARNEIRRALGRESSAASLLTRWDWLDEELRAVYSQLESAPLAEDVLQREETREMVNATMAQLPQRYREALEAKYVAGKTIRDLAELWQISEKAAESQLTRARQAFRATFGTLAKSFGLESGL